MTPSQRQRFEALPYGSGPSTDDALARLEEEVAARGAMWRISQKLVLAAPWDQCWKAGAWVSSRTGQRAKSVASHARMTPSQRQRFEALPYGSGVSTDDALARLEEEAATRGPMWRISQRLVLAAPWDQCWKAGAWVGNRTGQRAKSVVMTPSQRQRFEALPYGSGVSTDDALARLEEEAATRGAGCALMTPSQRQRSRRRDSGVT